MDPGLPNGKVSLARTHSVNASRTRPASRPVGWLACACGHDPALPGPNTRRVRGASFRDLAGPEGPGRPFHGAANSGVSGIGRFVGPDFADFGGPLPGDPAGQGGLPASSQAGGVIAERGMVRHTDAGWARAPPAYTPHQPPPA